MKNRELAETLLEVVNKETNDYDAIDSMVKILDGYHIRSKTVVNAEMKVENCDWNLKWDYSAWKLKGNDTPLFGTQKDWNQTSMTKMNQLSAQISKASFRGGAKFITAHPAMERLFKSLEYYKDNSLGKRYSVNFDDKVKYNEIFIYQEMWNKFHTIPMTSVDDAGMHMLDFKDKTKCTETEKIEFNSKLIGCITVDNYE